jgi:hypothetical protein
MTKPKPITPLSRVLLISNLQSIMIHLERKERGIIR